MKDTSLKDLLEAGCHFGHKKERWHPKAQEFIYTEKDGTHIIDLAKTKEGLKIAAAFAKSLVAEGREIVFVGTKRQAKGVVWEETKRVGAPYFVERFIGGFLTNWSEVSKNFARMRDLRAKIKNENGVLKKKEIVLFERNLRKLEIIYGGVENLFSPPSALFIVDSKKEANALREAKRTGVKIIAIVDTNSDPTQVDFPIPANDDAVGSIKLITNYIADAYSEGKKLFEKKGKEEEKPKEEEPVTKETTTTKVKNKRDKLPKLKKTKVKKSKEINESK